MTVAALVMKLRAHSSKVVVIKSGRFVGNTPSAVDSIVQNVNAFGARRIAMPQRPCPNFLAVVKEYDAACREVPSRLQGNRSCGSADPARARPLSAG
jgi:hypothetical protein